MPPVGARVPDTIDLHDRSVEVGAEAARKPVGHRRRDRIDDLTLVRVHGHQRLLARDQGGKRARTLAAEEMVHQRGGRLIRSLLRRPMDSSATKSTSGSHPDQADRNARIGALSSPATAKSSSAIGTFAGPSSHRGSRLCLLPPGSRRAPLQRRKRRLRVQDLSWPDRISRSREARSSRELATRLDCSQSTGTLGLIDRIASAGRPLAGSSAGAVSGRRTTFSAVRTGSPAGKAKPSDRLSSTKPTDIAASE